jgi:hypothetical protein
MEESLGEPTQNELFYERLMIIGACYTASSHIPTPYERLGYPKHPSYLSSIKSKGRREGIPRDEYPLKRFALASRIFDSNLSFLGISLL